MKFVIFDIDGTLTNTKKVDDWCFISAFKQTFEIDIEQENWEAITHVTDWGITEEIIVREWGRTPSRLEYETMISNFIHLLNQEVENDLTQFAEVQGAISFFDRLKTEVGVELGIATGGWEESALLKLNAIGLNVEGVCLSNSNYFKSREEITKDVIRQLNGKSKEKPEKIIYFGDGLWDLDTCKNLGIDFIGIDVKGNDKLSNNGAKSVFKDFRFSDQILRLI